MARKIKKPPPPAPPPEWELVFEDHFTTWDPSRYTVYQTTWPDTSKNGRYGAPITSDGQKLRIHLHTDANGVPRVAAFIPRLPAPYPGTVSDLLGMRHQFRIRADRMVGYKGAPLLWPKTGNPWPEWGEINWPESGFEYQPKAYMHRQGATVGSDQDIYSSPPGTTWQDWHTYEVRWIPGVSCEFYIDDVLIGRSTQRVPEGPMHLVMQFETTMLGFVPDSSVSGYVEIDYLRVWAG